jgi:hypothetical protein
VCRHDGAKRLLNEAPRFQKTWELAAFPQLEDAQLRRAGTRLPQPKASLLRTQRVSKVRLIVTRGTSGLDIVYKQSPLAGEGCEYVHCVLFRRG